MSGHLILVSAEIQALLQFNQDFSRREGFELLVGNDGEDILRQARTRRPDIIFVAPQLSCQNPTCICRQLKEDDQLHGIPVVAVIDGNDPDERRHCIAARPDDVLFKPINQHLFLATARRVLGLAHRAFYRLQTSLIVQFGPARDQLRAACAYNLSSGGIFIATETPTPLNSSQFILLDLPTGREPILCQAIVTWINDRDQPNRPEIPAGIGLQFLSLSLSELFAIRDYIASHEQDHKGSGRPH